MLKNSSGFSLTETLIAMAMALTVTSLTAAAITEVFVKKIKAGDSAAGSVGEMEFIQSIRSPKTLRKLIALDDNKHLRDCLQHRGTSCKSFEAKTVEEEALSSIGLTKAFGRLSGCAKVSVNCPYSREITYSLKCQSDRACHGVEIVAKTFRHKKNGDDFEIAKTKVKSFFIAASEIESQASIDYTDCEGQVITGIDFKNKVALCNKESEVQECDGYSVMGVGTNSCGKTKSIKNDNSCNLKLSAHGNDIKIKYSTSGEESTRIAYNCWANSGSVSDAVNIVYFKSEQDKQGTATIKYKGKGGVVACRADLKGEGKNPLDSCQHSVKMVIASESSSDSGKKSSGKSGKKKKYKKKVSKYIKVKLGSKKTASVKGDGSSFGVKTSTKNYYTNIKK